VDALCDGADLDRQYVQWNAYLSNVAASQVDANVLNILAGTDLSGMSGAQFYVGYGTTAEEMMAAERYRIMYQVP